MGFWLPEAKPKVKKKVLSGSLMVYPQKYHLIQDGFLGL
jgi:hypothetical protein